MCVSNLIQYYVTASLCNDAYNINFKIITSMHIDTLLLDMRVID